MTGKKQSTNLVTLARPKHLELNAKPGITTQVSPVIVAAIVNRNGQDNGTSRLQRYARLTQTSAARSTHEVCRSAKAC